MEPNVGFAYPFGNNFALMFWSLGGGMIVASICDWFLDGFWWHLWYLWDCFWYLSKVGSFYEICTATKQEHYLCHRDRSYPRKIMLERDFPHLFGYCFLHWLLPGPGIENSKMTPFRRALGIIFLFVRFHLRDDFSKAIFEPWRGEGAKSPQPLWDHWAGQIHVSANTRD